MPATLPDAALGASRLRRFRNCLLGNCLLAEVMTNAIESALAKIIGKHDERSPSDSCHDIKV